MKLFIDPGHGGHDSGAVGLSGLRECDVVMDLANRLQAIAVEHGFTVGMSRSVDRFVPLSERAAIANRWGADLFVALHCNAAENRTAAGIEVWTTPGQTKADSWAESVLVEMGAAFPHENLRRDTSDGDSDREANFAVLRLTNAPAILVETGFISHAATEMSMRTDAWRDRVVAAIMQGILAHQAVPA